MLTPGLLCMAAGAVQALEPPTGVVLLTVGGRVRNANDGRRAQFDMAMIEALTQQTVVTRTPWFSKARRFTGPLLRDLLPIMATKSTSPAAWK